MALTPQDNNLLAKILEDKMSEKDINKVIDLANKKSFYYGLKDSPLNRPSLAKVASLWVFIFCMWLFAIQPLFFADKANVENLSNELVESSLSRGGIPPVSSFKFSVNVKDAGIEWGNIKQTVEIVDSHGQTLAKSDLVNGYWTAVFGKLSESLQISSEDREKIMNMSRFELEDDKKALIKDFLDNALEYSSFIPEIKSVDYGVDTLINSSIH